MENFKCSICGYVYSPIKGDPSQGVHGGTPFTSLSEMWECPVCGGEKECFERVRVAEVSLELGKRI